MLTIRTNEDAPVDSPLLNANDAASNVGRRKFGEVDTDLRRGDAD